MKPLGLLLVALALCLVAVTPTAKVSSFSELAEAHCASFPIELFYRLSTGQLAEIYGAEYQALDCYVRQFVNKDGQDTFQEEEEDQEDEEDSAEPEVIPDIDPVVEEYAKGLACLPASVNRVEAVYAMWRFFRFLIQHDYLLEWMRAKVRASLGYEAERPSAWMDGEQAGGRVRLDKLFSNQFYDYVDSLMFKDFLHPIITFFKKNTVFAASGAITQSGKPILIQIIENKNLLEKTFLPVLFQHPTAGPLFSYTIPGLPLLLAGSNARVAWAFTGVLVDRSNIEQIETLGSKFFHTDSEVWIKLNNVTEIVKVKGEQDFQCKFVHSNYGTLYEKHQSRDGGKVSEYIARWHENQKKVRVLFSHLLELIVADGQSTRNLEFPWSSLVLVNSSGIFQHLCYQKHPSYFLYPDLAGAAEPINEKWVSNFKRNFHVVSNTHLSTRAQEAYLKKEVMNPTEEQFLIETRRRLSSKQKFNLQTLFDYVNGVGTDPMIKKRKEVLIYIYRKAKFLFFPEEEIRKECDQIVAQLEKWNHNINSPSISPAFRLWDYFYRDYTFNYVSSNPLGLDIAKHWALTETYWTNQAENWKPGTSYGECDSEEWNLHYRDRLNGTGDNSTCFLNIMRAINRTREILRSEDGPIREPQLQDFLAHKVKDLREGYVGTPVEQIFFHFYSRNLAFAAEIGNPSILYNEGFQETRKEITLSAQPQANEQARQKVPEVIDDEL